MSARLTWRGEPILIFSITEKENSNALDNHTVSKWRHNVIALRLPPRAIFSHYLPSSFQIPRLAVRLVGGYKIVKKKQKKPKTKGQVGIKVDTRLNKEQPTKLQIYAPSAVCNCTQPEVCPLFAFFFFCTVHRRCLFRTQPSPGRYFQTPPVRSRCSNKRFPWAIY